MGSTSYDAQCVTKPLILRVFSLYLVPVAGQLGEVISNLTEAVRRPWSFFPGGLCLGRKRGGVGGRVPCGE